MFIQPKNKKIDKYGFLSLRVRLIWLETCLFQSARIDLESSIWTTHHFHSRFVDLVLTVIHPTIRIVGHSNNKMERDLVCMDYFTKGPPMMMILSCSKTQIAQAMNINHYHSIFIFQLLWLGSSFQSFLPFIFYFSLSSPFTLFCCCCLSFIKLIVLLDLKVLCIYK